MSLENLQAELADIILSGHTDCHFIRPSENISIYQNNISSTLIHTLKNTYPLIATLLGEEFFLETTRDYIHHYPSRSGNLYDYGEYFADFLTKYLSAANLAYLKEVAEFEWICHTVSCATNCAMLNIDALKKISPEQYQAIHFTLHPASQLKAFRYPILQIVDLCHHQHNDTIDTHEENLNLLIIRRHMNLSLVELTSAEFVFLNSLYEAHSLANALKAATLIESNFKLEEKLLGWIQDKTIVDYY